MAEIVNPVPLQITIGSYPTNSLNLDQELKLLKAAILYGDQVELYSLKASLISMMLKLKDIPVSLQIRLLEDITPYIKTDVESAAVLKSLQVYKEIITKRPRPRSVLIMQQQFAYEWLQIRNVAVNLAIAAGFQEIDRTIAAGVVKLHTFETAKSQLQAVDYIADCVALASHSPLLAERRPKMEIRDDLILAEFVQGMFSAVNDGASLPLFDEQTSSLVDAGIRVGIIVPSELAKKQAKHSGLAASLLEKLPHFEGASIDQVLTIRGELDRPLIRFRSALIKYSEMIKSAAWDKEFPTEAEIVFCRDVAPAILDIEDATKSNNLVVAIIRGLVEKPLVITSGSVLGLAISKLSSLPEALTLSIGAGAAASGIISDAYKAWSEKNLVVQQNAMYFYYCVDKKLE